MNQVKDRKVNAEADYSLHRIALFTTTLAGGGAERATMSIAQEIANRGFSVDLVVTSTKGDYDISKLTDVNVIDLKVPKISFCLPGLINYLRQYRPHAMISMLSPANVMALTARKLSSIPLNLVVVEQNTLSQQLSSSKKWQDRVLPTLMKYTYPWANKIIGVSEGVVLDLVQTLNLKPERVKVIYNPIVFDEISLQASEILEHPWFQPDQPPVVIGVGRLVPQKDFVTLIKAFDLVRKHIDARLVILGEGPERGYLESLIEQLGLNNLISMPGFVKNPFKFMKRASVFVLSSRFEGSPLVLAEALGVGTSVVSTNCLSGPSEILQDGLYGKLVPVGNFLELSTAILKVLKSDNLDNSSLINRAKAFDIKSITTQYLSHLLN